MKNRLSVNVGLVLILAGLMPLSAHSQTDVTVSVGARDPAVAPDGSTIAVSIFGKIWLVPIEGGAARQLTFGPGWDTSPAWSPDGRTIAFVSELDGDPDIFTMDVNGQNQTRITNNDSADTHPRW